MKYKMCVGRVTFAIETPFKVFWKKEDLQFIEYSRQPDIQIIVQEVKELPEISGKLKYRNSEMLVYSDANEQIRYYYTPISKMAYACSLYKQQTIRLWVKSGAGVIESQNHIWDYMHLEKIFLQHQGFILHCAYTEYAEKAICYTAPSGTGKTTHATHWVRKYNAKILNGDKALLKKETSGWFVHGYPFHGSSAECVNTKRRLDTLVILRQGIVNRVEELSPIEKIRLLYNEITVNTWDPQAVSETLILLEDLVSQVRVIKFYCTKYEDSAEVLYQYLYGGN